MQGNTAHAGKQQTMQAVKRAAGVLLRPGNLLQVQTGLERPDIDFCEHRERQSSFILRSPKQLTTPWALSQSPLSPQAGVSVQLSPSVQGWGRWGGREGVFAHLPGLTCLEGDSLAPDCEVRLFRKPLPSGRILYLREILTLHPCSRVRLHWHGGDSLPQGMYLHCHGARALKRQCSRGGESCGRG